MNEYLRHTLATISYRLKKSLSRSTNEFGDFSCGQGSRSTAEIVRHMYQVVRAATDFIRDGEYDTASPESLNLTSEAERFHAGLIEFDHLLKDKNIGSDVSKRLLQGPLADILTHIGQISMMSRLHGHPLEGEDFAAAPIEIGIFSTY